jgi:hypothetical protein
VAFDQTVTSADAEAAAALYLERGWTDGLPIVLPTLDRVEAFLAAAGRDPDEVLLRVDENARDVTVGLAAVNAVMAGCWPACFPLVLAAVEGWADPRWGDGDRTYFYISNASTGGGAQMAVVNGPIRGELGMNCGVNLYGPGNRANATIGRALRLIIRNALGVSAGVLDHACQGHPGKYSFCIAENEEDSPWEPLHVEHGFCATDSTVMVYSGRGPEPVENRLSGSPEGILFSIADTMSRVGAMISRGEAVLVVMGPEHAGIIGRKHGWSKQDVKQHLYENFKRPFADMARCGMKLEHGAPRTRAIDGVDYLYGCRGPEDIHVIVAGGANAGVSSVITNWGYHVPAGECIIKPIAPPAGPGPRRDEEGVQ